MNRVADYFRELCSRTGQGWNAFWFTPADPHSLAALRIGTGLLALWYLFSFVTDLVVWFGPHGLLPVDTVQTLTSAPSGEWNGRASFLYLVREPALLWGTHILAMLFVVAFTVGFYTRLSAIATLVIVLSYVHRAPMITGPFEPILTMLLFYLCWAPSGRCFSVDGWLRRRANPHDRSEEAPSLAAGVCLRLVQVHAAALYLMMALTKLGGSDTWWIGEAMWWLIARSESRLVDLTFLAGWEYGLNAWTHAVVIFEFAFALLVWNRWARPLLLAWSVVHWLMLGLVTGLLSFSAAMLVVNLAYVSPSFFRSYAWSTDAALTPSARTAMSAG